MKFETLKSFNKKKLIIPTIIICSLIIVITIFISRAKYIYKDSITIIDGTVNYKPYDFKIVEMYIENSGYYVETETMPTTGYEINTDKTYCYIDNESIKITNKIYTNEEGEHIIKELPKMSKCVLYFDKEVIPPKVQIITSSQGNNVHFDGTSCKSSCDYQENGVYEDDDDDGTSYYFRGNVENNYVKFGKMGSTNSGEDIWWRIIRINGDGSIRMIFAGTGTGRSAPMQTGVKTMIGKRAFNTSEAGNIYVGFEYEDGVLNGNSKGENGHKSRALEVLEEWFETNLKDEFDNGYIDTNAGFCADRTKYSSESASSRDDNLGVGWPSIYYGGYIRAKITHEPTFICEDKAHDLFTYEQANQGTKSLTYPIGLITIDEILYAGNIWDGFNTGYYLQNSQPYWTMSPATGKEGAHVLSVTLNSQIYSMPVYSSSDGLRPVINLGSEVLTKGSGKYNDPFVVA